MVRLIIFFTVFNYAGAVEQPAKRGASLVRLRAETSGRRRRMSISRRFSFGCPSIFPISVSGTDATSVIGGGVRIGGDIDKSRATAAGRYVGLRCLRHLMHLRAWRAGITATVDVRVSMFDTPAATCGRRPTCVISTEIDGRRCPEFSWTRAMRDVRTRR